MVVSGAGLPFAAEAALRRDALVDQHPNANRLAGTAGRAPDQPGGPPNEVRLVRRNAGGGARQRKGAVVGFEDEDVVELQRLEDRLEEVIAVGADAEDARDAPGSSLPLPSLARMGRLDELQPEPV